MHDWKKVFTLSLLLFFCFNVSHIFAKEKKQKSEFSLPEQVLSIAKENTYPNITEDLEIIEPSKETKGLLDSIDMTIDNIELIALLNETTIKPSPIGFGYNASIYLGRYPLSYQSENTSVMWDYQPINKNELSNAGGDEAQELQYNQKEEKAIKGALTNKITSSKIVKQMILEKTKQKTKLPLSFTTKIGQNTKLSQLYRVPKDKMGSLNAYAPAINEKGSVTFGEVYIRLKGTGKKLVIKNVSKQGIGAWIPIQDHVSLNFQLK